MNNIPIFRAKEKDSDKYVEGFYVEVGSAKHIYCNENIGFGTYLIDPSTLAIHFPDMLDSQGNKIFASLSEDGKGGDVGMNPDYDDNRYVFIYSKSAYEFGIKLIQTDSIGCWEYSPLQEEDLDLFEVEGIQE